ncbi:hypothetical protein [Campylobacter ureolyticus]|uniref:hypothetical protein n=1 Tax=Campylobacter ureolyticus TaxID=827 RepID=UPI0022B4ADB6|nr:hypothetical protein [Campylobacter ureolyticus]MCZ6162939.1 hypothetical protein [Campylobacter ureolyticus]MCZ6164568.1 hypothetical protein [Campylobacter ureolyticus]
MQEVEVIKEKEIKPVDSKGIENLLINGNLESLNEKQRIEYYSKVCDSLGLNPLTKPFDYIKLSGKLTLYANKNATEQLRKIYKVSILDMNTDQVGDVLVTKCKVQDGMGRTDVGTGAVTVGNLRGDALANAIMKSETKAKRRATLSICGLGMLDESELETIKDAYVVPEKEAISDKQIMQTRRDDGNEFRKVLMNNGIKNGKAFQEFANIKSMNDVKAYLDDMNALLEKIDEFKKGDK